MRYLKIVSILPALAKVTLIYNLLLFPTVSSRNSDKAVQTKDRTSSLDFPTPPPAITDANEYSEQSPDEYLSLKVEKSDSTSLYPDIYTSSSVTVTYASFSRSIHANRNLAEETDRQRQKTDIRSGTTRRGETEKKKETKQRSLRKSRRKRRNSSSTRN